MSKWFFISIIFNIQIIK